MPRPSAQDLSRLVAAVAAAPDGLDLQALQTAAIVHGERRTLQRRLAQLVHSGRLVAVGRGPATHYRIPPAAMAYPADAAPPPFEIRTPTAIYVPLGAEAVTLQLALERPTSMRIPVDYQTAFLETYRPNQSAYLSPHQQASLRHLARSPADHDAPGAFARRILARLRTDLSYGSSHLDGNGYSRTNTERLFASERTPPTACVRDTQMILNHGRAIEFLVEPTEPLRLEPLTIQHLHALLSEDLLSDPADGGQTRRHAIGIRGSVYRPPNNPQSIASLLRLVLETAAAIRDPFEQSFFLLVHVSYLQPFADANECVARLAANIPLIAHNYCPIAFVDVPTELYAAATLAVYELNRIELLRDVYIHALGRSAQDYVAKVPDMATPDLFRQQHRRELDQTMTWLVRGLHAATPANIDTTLPSTIEASDRETFIALVISECAALNPYNGIRFGLQTFEVEAWQERTEATADD